MINYLALANVETGEVFHIEISGVDIFKVSEELDKLPKNEKGAPQVGNIRIYQFGGGTSKSPVI